MGFETLIRMLSLLSFVSFYVSFRLCGCFFRLTRKSTRMYDSVNIIIPKIVNILLSFCIYISSTTPKRYHTLDNNSGQKKNIKTVHNFWKKKDNWVLRFFLAHLNRRGITIKVSVVVRLLLQKSILWNYWANWKQQTWSPSSLGIYRFKMCPKIAPINKHGWNFKKKN